MRHASLLLVLSLALPAAAAEREKMVVLEIRAERVDAALKNLLEPIIHGEIARRYDVIGNSDVQELVGLEQQKQLLGCGEESSCLAEIGGALGARWVTSGNIGKVGALYVVNLRLVDAQKAKVLERVTETVDGPEEQLVAGVQRAVRRLLHLDDPAPAPVAAAPKPAPVVVVPVAAAPKPAPVVVVPVAAAPKPAPVVVAPAPVVVVPAPVEVARAPSESLQAHPSLEPVDVEDEGPVAVEPQGAPSSSPFTVVRVQRSNAAAWTGVGLGFAAAGVGAWFGYSALQTADAARTTLKAPTPDGAHLVTYAGQQEKHADQALYANVLGGAGLGLALVSWLFVEEAPGGAGDAPRLLVGPDGISVAGALP